MKYISTRNTTSIASSSQAIINGLSHDGGLFTPERIPVISNFTPLLAMDYLQLTYTVLCLFFDDMDRSQLQTAIQKAYTGNFANDEVAPLSKCRQGWLMELWHGPTGAFKDVALTLLPHLMKIAYRQENETDLISILTATSGDTGKAAIRGFADIENTAITVLYPEIGVSDIQKRQMQTSSGKNVEVIAVKGNFDDCQRLVKEAINSPAVNHACRHIKLSSANSINIGRLIPQIVYYFDAYLKLVRNHTIQINNQVNFVVPSGNFGNILAGYIAKQMGLPIKHLICASNRNNVLTDFIRTGTYCADRKFHPTISPSMDILISSNLERLLFMASEHDADLINILMTSLKEKKKYTVPIKLLHKIRQTFRAYDCIEEECKAAIFETFFDQHTVIDPHTAVAMHACNQYQKEYGQSTPCIILSTASPYKFPQDVYAALTKRDISDGFAAMDALYAYTGMKIPDHLAQLKNMKIRFHTIVRQQDAIQAIVKRMEDLQHDYD